MTAKIAELDRVGTELWNLSTRLLRTDTQSDGNTKDEAAKKNLACCLLRVFAFLVLDTAGGQSIKAGEHTRIIRLMKLALKTARVCIAQNRLDHASKVLERATKYQEVIGSHTEDEGSEEGKLVKPLLIDYLAVRITLVSQIHT